MKRLDLINKKFGRLTVLYCNEEKTRERSLSVWHCKCDCGNEVDVLGYMLNNGKTKSCGCLAKELASRRLKQYNRYEEYDDYIVGYDNKGNQFYFDKFDFNLVKEYCWSIRSDGYVYARDINNKEKHILMHKLLLNTSQTIDHINHNRADNRRCNLRIVTNSQNCMNRSMHKNNTSGIVGVGWHKRDNIWEARISINNKQIYLGRFTNLDDAIKARQEAEEKYFNEYSYNNSIKGA